MRGLPNASVSVTRCNHGITETDVYRFSNRFRNFHHHRHHLHRTWSLAPATAVHVEWSVASWRTSKADRFTSDVTGLCGTYYHAVDANPALEAQSRLREWDEAGTANSERATWPMFLVDRKFHNCPCNDFAVASSHRPSSTSLPLSACWHHKSS